MWTLGKLEIDGLMSFDHADIDFSGGGVHVIYGKNLDIGSDKSNGSGKSAVIEGIGFGITGAPLRKVSIKELVNDEKKSAVINIELINKGIGEKMRIERLIFRSKSSIAKVFINNDEISNLTSTDDVNKFVMEKIGISKEDLLNFFVLMSSKFTPFLEASDTKKKEVINRFSNGVIVDVAIDDMTEHMEICKEELDPEIVKRGKLESTLGALKETLSETMMLSDDTIDIEDQKKTFLESIQIHTQSKDFLEFDLKKYEEKLLSVEQEISECLDPDELIDRLNILKKELNLKSRERSDLRDLVDDLKHQRKHIDFQINGALSCPKCEHSFDPSDEDFDLKKSKEIRKGLILNINETISKGKTVRSELDKIQSEVSSLDSRIDKIVFIKRNLQEAVLAINKNISKTRISIDDCNNKIESINIKISGLDSREKVDAVTPLRERIDQTEKLLVPIEDKIQDLSEEMEDYVKQLDYFRRFKSYLANLSLKSMESLVNDFLDDFGSDIFIELSGEKKLGNGKMKEKIDAMLVRNGTDIGSFPKRSGGEKAGINLAFAKTLSHLINLNAGEGRGLDLLIIDEILDSSDAEGMTNIVRAFEKSEDNVVIITHIPLPASVGQPITVVKENDCSRILESDGE